MSANRKSSNGWTRGIDDREIERLKGIHFIGELFQRLIQFGIGQKLLQFLIDSPILRCLFVRMTEVATETLMFELSSPKDVCEIMGENFIPWDEMKKVYGEADPDADLPVGVLYPGSIDPAILRHCAQTHYLLPIPSLTVGQMLAWSGYTFDQDVLLDITRITSLSAFCRWYLIEKELLKNPGCFKPTQDTCLIVDPKKHGKYCSVQVAVGTLLTLNQKGIRSLNGGIYCYCPTPNKNFGHMILVQLDPEKKVVHFKMSEGAGSNQGILIRYPTLL
ncbi:MAG: hypothetical protein WCW14_00485 [Candidatus Paceibacterota bacterium]|jgi:hypothetical protein